MKIVFLERKNLGEDLDFSRFDELGEVVSYDTSTTEEAKERMQDAEIVLINKIPMNRETLAGAKKLQLICVTATGTNNVDFDYVRERGITVTNVSGYSTATVAQHTFALYFYLMEHLSYYDQYVRSGEYEKSELFTHFSMPFHDLCGQTWGIVGLGAIGREVAKIATAFGANVIYYSTSGKNHNPEYTQVDFDTLLKESDVISVHAPLTPETLGLFNEAAFSKMKAGAYFLNLGRGAIVVENDLAEALQSGRIAGAGLDVLSAEPMQADNPLAKLKHMPNLVITPHVAWASIEARMRLLDMLYENIRCFLEGVPGPNVL
ncbi:MAG: D-2-hydroxyacid dehydrogenase [Clostridiales bacterium]|nr:D-2-hydroxyacid dehydrogenase [Clostridiales bacterium]